MFPSLMIIVAVLRIQCGNSVDCLLPFFLFFFLWEITVIISLEMRMHLLLQVSRFRSVLVTKHQEFKTKMGEGHYKI